MVFALWCRVPIDKTCFPVRKKYDTEVMLRVVLRYDTILYGHYIRLRLLLH